MLLLLRIIVILFTFISLETEAMAELRSTSIVLPVHKHTDASKPLYSAEVMTAFKDWQFTREKFLIDIDAPIIWHKCFLLWNENQGDCPANISCSNPVDCQEFACEFIRNSPAYKSPYCPSKTKWSTLPVWGLCTCPVNVANPVTASCVQVSLNRDVLRFNKSNGRNIYTGRHTAYPTAACVPSSSLQSFPANVTGVLALSSSLYALQQYVDPPFERVLGLCLPSTLSTPGVLFYGRTRYYLLPQSQVNVRSYLSYTPLIEHQNSFSYFIGVNKIVIKKRSVDIPTNATTKISTTDPYTILRTDIYNPVVRRFLKVTKRIPPAKPVRPFGVCFSTSTKGTHIGFTVPDIEFGFPNGKKWIMSTANSIKQVTKDIACLALVDGGATSEPAIIIGTFQMEDNFLVFDLENSTFGFSSSLLRKKTSCSNFNFTLVDSYV